MPHASFRRRAGGPRHGGDVLFHGTGALRSFYRRDIFAIVTLFSVAHFPGASIASDEAGLSLAELESKVTSHRAAVINGALEADYAFTYNMADAVETTQEGSYRYWFDGNKRRADNIQKAWRTPKGRIVPEHTEIQCQGCYTDDTVFQQDDQPSSNGLRLATITDVELVKRRRLPDLRNIGMAPVMLIHTGKVAVDSYVGTKARTDAALESVLVNGRPCWRIVYEKVFAGDGTAHVTVTIDPAEGFSVIEISEDARWRGSRYLSTIKCRNVEYSDSKIWFPRNVVFEHFTGPAEPLKRDMYEDVDVRVVSLNNGIDESVFALESVRTLVPKSPVRRVSADPDPLFANGDAIWIGGRLEPARLVPQVDLAVNQVAPVNVARRYIVASVLLGFGLLLAAWLWRSRIA